MDPDSSIERSFQVCSHREDELHKLLISAIQILNILLDEGGHFS